MPALASDRDRARREGREARRQRGPRVVGAQPAEIDPATETPGQDPADERSRGRTTSPPATAATPRSARQTNARKRRPGRTRIADRAPSVPASRSETAIAPHPSR